MNIKIVYIKKKEKDHMGKELAVVLINPYTIAKSRTGGVIGRFLSRTCLELVNARMFTPSKELAQEYAKIIESFSSEKPKERELLTNYVINSYSPNRKTNLPHRVLMLLLEGNNAVNIVKKVAGSALMGGGETVRDTFGDYVNDKQGSVQYFEPAVLVGSSVTETKKILLLWSKYSQAEGGTVTQADDVKETPDYERTLVLIKPDNFKFPNARPGNIIDILSRSGLRIVATKVHRMSVEQAEAFYTPIKEGLQKKLSEHLDNRIIEVLNKEFSVKVPETGVRELQKHLAPLITQREFNKVIQFMTGINPEDCSKKEKKAQGKVKCLALVYAGKNAVKKIRKLLGSTDPQKAPPGSVRREFGSDIMVNAAHASDSKESFERETSIIKINKNTVPEWVKKYYGRGGI
jgi:nucleoside diphosphate kinase